MKKTLAPLLLVAIAAQLSGCGKGEDKQPAASPAPSATQAAQPEAKTTKFSLDDGVAICLKQVKAALGDNAKVAEVSSSFQIPEQLQKHPMRGFARPKPKSLTACRVDYQDPGNANKLLRREMNTETGEFGEVKPVEISVAGDASKFKLSDHVIAVTSWNIEGIEKQVAAQHPKAEAQFSTYQISSARLKKSAFNGKTEFNVHFDGRLKANDLISSSYVDVSPDGAKVLGTSLK